MGKDGSAYKLRIGDPAGTRLTWDGTTLSVVGVDGDGITNIDGGNIQTNTITADKITVGQTGNEFTNAEFRYGLGEGAGSGDSWREVGNDTGQTWTSGVSWSNYTLVNSGTAYFHTEGTPANATVFQIGGPWLVVEAGKRYEASVYLGLHRTGNTYVAVTWWDQYNSNVGTSTGNACTTAKEGGAYLSLYCRSVLLDTAPTGAVKALIYIHSVQDGEGTPWIFFTHTQFGERPAGTTAASPWVAGGVTRIVGDSIKTGTIVADKIAANTITASQIAANTITASQIAANTITASQMSVVGGWTWAADYFKKDSGTEATSSGMAPLDWPFYAGASYANRATAPFRVSPAGAVTASSGLIGGFTVGANIFWTGSGATSVGLYSASTGGDDVRFWAGSSDIGTAPFRVTEGGALTATNASISGTVNASAGYFGNSSNDVSIDSDGIVVGSSGRISAGGGAVTIGNGGIELDTGANSVNQYRFDNGAYTRAFSTDGIILQAPGQVWFQLDGGALITMDTGSFSPSNNSNSNLDLGGSGGREWVDFYLDSDFVWNNPPGSTSAIAPLVWNGGDYKVYRKTNTATSCTNATSIDAEYGIITYCSDPITPQIQALQQDVASLKNEVADLKAQVAALLALLGGRQ